MGRIVSEEERVGVPITTSREPKGPVRSGDKGSVGDMAVMDAVIIVGAAWLILLFLGFSLRAHTS